VIAQESAAEGEEGPPPPTQGALRAKSADGSWVGKFPLEHTDVRGEIGGYLARTVVAQTFGNPFREPIEAVYAFPLPASAAVNDFVMEVGGRTIVGIVRPREEAERIYEEARAQGRTASLLSQERPNLFTEQVANIAAGESVTVKITFFERLIPEKGRYEWVFPMVVGPRYVPGTPRPAAAEGRAGAGGTSPPTTVVRDADRITPPVLRDGERSGHDIALEVTLDAGLPLRNLTSVAHRVSVREPSASKRVVKLSEADGIPNRDFVLRWEVDGEETRFGVVSHRADDGGYLTLMVQPPTAPSDAQAVPREITFIIDVSGSMSGIPLDLSKALVRRVLDSLRPDDAFNVHYFASGSGQLWPTPREKTAENVRAARQYLDGLGSGGGTEMFEGLRRSLGAQHDPRRVQMYVFLTDGFVGDEERILRLVESDRGEARFFAFGIGSSVNRYLIDGIGAVGGGASRMLLPRDPDAVETAAAGLFALIDSPVLVDVAIDWNGLPVSDVYPSKLPDLFAGGTLDVVARYDRPATGTIYVTARSGSERVRIPVAVVLPEREEANAALAPVWARWRIADLEGELRAAEDENARKAVAKRITDLAVDYRLASAFTSFVAVDEERVVGDGRPLRVMQPVEVPEDVSREGAVGERPEREAIRIPVWGLTLATGAGGSVRVYAVDPGSPADRAGIAVGATVRTVNRTAVHDMAHLEGLLVQHAASARLGLDPGGEVSLPAP
jgi:Ca-activated chloride channel family protein